MSKHHHQSRAEQINNKIHGAASFHQNKIYHERGGPDLDIWPEAGRILSSNDPTVSSFINEGNPNTQK